MIKLPLSVISWDWLLNKAFFKFGIINNDLTSPWPNNGIHIKQFFFKIFLFLSK